MIEKMKQWLEVLEYWDIHGGLNQPTEDAITSLRQAIKELESQEPVAWADHGVVNWIADKQFKHASLLYTHPPQRTWVGLTDEEIDKTHETQVWDARRSYARAIEAKLKERNS